MNMKDYTDYHSLYLRMGYTLIRDDYLRTIGARAFAVFIVIRTYANLDNIAFPSIETISKQSGLCVRSVQNELKKLTTYGWISISKSRGRNGKYSMNNYKILETDLIRGSNEDSFIDKPSANNAYGVSVQPQTNNHMRESTI